MAYKDPETFGIGSSGFNAILALSAENTLPNVFLEGLQNLCKTLDKRAGLNIIMDDSLETYAEDSGLAAQASIKMFPPRCKAGEIPCDLFALAPARVFFLESNRFSKRRCNPNEQESRVEKAGR